MRSHANGAHRVSVVNLLVLGALIALVLSRTGGGKGELAAGEVAEGFQRVSAELRAESTAQRAELQQALSLSQQEITARVQQGSEAQSRELARERGTRREQP